LVEIVLVVLEKKSFKGKSFMPDGRLTTVDGRRALRQGISYHDLHPGLLKILVLFE